MVVVTSRCKIMSERFWWKFSPNLMVPVPMIATLPPSPAHGLSFNYPAWLRADLSLPRSPRGSQGLTRSERPALAPPEAARR
jgi:hypothetical protein